MEHWQNNNNEGKPKYSEKKLSQWYFTPTIHSMWAGMGLNLGLNGDRQQLTA
jgi:hypothetical protein